MADAPDGLDLPLHEESVRDPGARLIAIGAVLATLAAAVVGYLQIQASKAEDGAAAEAQSLSVDAFGQISTSRDDAATPLGLVVRAEVLRREAASAHDELVLGDGRSDSVLRAEESRLRALAAGAEERASTLLDEAGLPALDLAGPLGPLQDSYFPFRYLAAVDEQSVELTALRDAANEEATERGKQVASYVVMLAMLAVAVYLFGFSLTPHGRSNRRLFAVAASGLASVAAAWAFVVSVAPPERASDEAATAFAAAEVAAAHERYGKAIDLYSRAIDLRPSFGRAYRGRADAYDLRGAPFQATFTSITAPEEAQLSLEDERAALERGLDDALLMTNIGFSSITAGISQGSSELIQEGIEFSRRAEAADPDEPIPTANIALGELALGLEEEARETYARAAEKIIFVEGEPRQDPILEQSFLSGALTDLEILLANTDGEFDDSVEEIKQYLVDYVLRGAEPPEEPGGDPSQAALGAEPAAFTAQADTLREQIKIDVSPARAELRIPTDVLNLDREQVSVQWYYRTDFGWSALEDLSGPVMRDETLPGGAGEKMILRYTFSDAPCLPSGDYRVEVYAGGEPPVTKELSTGDSTTDFGSLKEVYDRDVGYTLCYPADWKPASREVEDLVEGYVSGDGSRGVYLMRLHDRTLNQTDDRSAKQALDTALEELSPLPSTPTIDRSARFSGARKLFIFANMRNPWTGALRYREGRALFGAAVDVDGAVFAAILFGPSEYFSTDEPYDVINSIQNY